MLIHRFDRGDTIVEVLFAITVFSAIAIGSLAIMNRGTATAQRSLEITLVREQMDTQAQALRFLSDAYTADYGKNGQATAVWKQIVEANAIAPGQAQAFSDVAGASTCVLPTNAFFALDYKQLAAPKSAVLLPTAAPVTYAKIRYDTAKPTAEGIWIQAVRSVSKGAGAGYYDFHITACWNSPGQQTPVTVGTMVRVYEPRG